MANISHISDELLAAYLDGNTSPDETRQVLNAMRDDASLRETINVALQVHREPVSVLPMAQMAAQAGENLCCVMCEAYVLARRGIDYCVDDLLATARSNHWLRPEGAPLHAIGHLLASRDLMVMRRYDATVADIVDVLECDNDVIVALDGDKLYPGGNEGGGAANHAVVVTRVSSGGKELVIYDPAVGDLRTVPAADFQNSWQTSMNYMVRVLQTAEEYEPRPINLGDVELTEDLLELREAIAENAHDVWAAARMKEGWTYGPERDDAQLRHPDLIPYSALPDSEKEYDRLMALDTIKLVKKLGFTIIKR